MNPIQLALKQFNKPVSPLPSTDWKDKSIEFAINQMKKTPESIYRASPPGDMFNRLAINDKYNPTFVRPQDVPYPVQLENNIETGKHGARAAIMAVIAGLAGRPLMNNPLKNGEQLKKLQDGRGWERFDRILNKKI